MSNFVTVPMQKEMMGSRYRDKVSGFEGTVTAISVYMSSEPKALLEAVSAQGPADDRWVPVNRMERLPPGRTGFRG